MKSGDALKSVSQFVALRLLRGYKRLVSPWFPTACRYLPSCSEYAIEAVDRYGALRGCGLAARRLLRCHPLAGAGYDPVPDLYRISPAHGPLNPATLRPTRR